MCSRVLVTGGAGFVGHRLVRELAAQGAARGAVGVLDDLSVGLPMPQEPGVPCWVGDVRDDAQVGRVMEEFRPDAVVHLAAIHHIPTCEAAPRRAMDVNVVGFQTVLDRAAQHGCRRVILASSGAVYDWRDGPLAEDAPVRPSDVYSASKLANEHQLAVWCSHAGRSGAIARLFNVIGPGDPNAHFIPDILRRLTAAPAGTAVRIAMGNLHTRRDMVDADDIAAGLAMLARHSDAPSLRAYNFCSGGEISMVELAAMLAEACGVTAEFFSDPAFCRANDRTSQWGNPERTATELGWTASRRLQQSVAAIVEAFGPRAP